MNNPTFRRCLSHLVLVVSVTLSTWILPSNLNAELLPISDDRYVSEADLVGMSPAMLRIARNEIFARHGYTFNSKDLQRHFSQYAWYRPFTKSVSLSSVERANVAFIKRYENSPSLQANLRIVTPVAPIQQVQSSTSQTTVIVAPASNPQKLEEAQAAIEDLSAEIAALNALLLHQTQKAEQGGEAAISILAKAELAKMLAELQGSKKTQEKDAQARYQTSIRPKVDYSQISPRELTRHFPKIPWYDPQYADKIGEFWLEARVSDDGLLFYDLKFLEPEYTTQNVASEFSLTPEDAEAILAALKKTYDWSERARKNNVRDFFRKTVDCTPSLQCEERVSGNTSTQVDFLVLEQGATGARLIRNKGAFQEEFGISIETAALLSSYFDFVLDLGKSTFEAGSRTDEQLDALFD